ncbi:hypothetical protein LWC34_06460 [Kibdelosporangium philippinense]|uniref:Uncharacterized protein n=1 Tax=Kibdelosporangium philippinense TaxID=211113 RepID=A0ABS8Z5Y8_9PSEU|nr:hypothetical protein [Kibdelosporangium philippinense]MCE7002473.1 hypothetical protein [Kibdelosporangium philippinense]
MAFNGPKSFWHVTLHNLQSVRVGQVLARYHTVGLVMWYTVIVAGVLQAFWTYWITLV